MAILLILRRRGRVTARELAEKLEVSERTIHRDMEALGIAGVPIYARRGAGGGWALLPGYELDVPGIGPEELEVLLLGPALSCYRTWAWAASWRRHTASWR